jgi:hypothetical protein
VTEKDEEMTESQRERFKTIQEVLKIQIDGEWDDVMMQSAFDHLEKLLFGLDKNAAPEPSSSSGSSGSSSSSGSGSSGNKRSRSKSGTAPKRKSSSKS